MCNQTQWYRYLDFGHLGFQAAKNKEAHWEDETKEIFKGSRLDEALG
ncbi:hypothetical protein [Psychrosphaera algicola]|uniref:Uncharacterized protein n=1 Tax=Psychrosphaera algicola TaxID=3023714 RepID=A0ABT5F908_9GAMM|nr:hypothetical protein [Psychrosphaera sp. G1-22]MDC2887614.1 hypothetical protein [Psychrosphaera sp. G1-22]